MRTTPEKPETLVERVIGASARNPFLVVILTLFGIAGGILAISRDENRFASIGEFFPPFCPAKVGIRRRFGDEHDASSKVPEATGLHDRAPDMIFHD